MPQGAILDHYADAVDDGTIVSHANTRFAWADLPKALDLQASGRSVGKNVVDVE
jgi:hypothetical protein